MHLHVGHVHVLLFCLPQPRQSSTSLVLSVWAAAVLLSRLAHIVGESSALNKDLEDIFDADALANASCSQ